MRCRVGGKIWSNAHAASSCSPRNTGTFTLSGLGVFGVDRFDAILPPGTGAILAVTHPSHCGGGQAARCMKRQMRVNPTADHRVIYSAWGCILKDLAELIETIRNPWLSELVPTRTSSSAVTTTHCRLSGCSGACGAASRRATYGA